MEVVNLLTRFTRQHPVVIERHRLLYLKDEFFIKLTVKAELDKSMD